MARDPLDLITALFPTLADAGLDDGVATGIDDVLAVVRAREGDFTDRRLRAHEHDLLCRCVAFQIVAGDPPAVRAAAERMLGTDMEERVAGSLLTRALLGFVKSVAKAEAGDGDGADGDGADGDGASGDGGPRFNLDAYCTVLELLPPPEPAEIATAFLAAAEKVRVSSIEQLLEEVTVSLDLPLDQMPFSTMIDAVFDALVTKNEDLALLPGDRVVNRRSITAGIVLTHVLTEREIAVDAIDATPDLALLAVDDAFAVALPGGDDGRKSEEQLVDVHVDEFSSRTSHVPSTIWHGPEGWLGAFSEGDTLAVRRRGDTVHISVLDAVPIVDPAVCDLLRAAYELGAQEDGLPQEIDAVVIAALADDPEAFTTPLPPLGRLLDEIGLEIRGALVADDEELWSDARSLRRWSRIFGRLDDDPSAAKRIAVLVNAMVDTDSSPHLVRPLLETLADPDLVDIAVDEVLAEANADEEGIDKLAAFARLLVHRASAPQHQAAARYLEAIAAEARNDPLAAHASLEIAVEADSRWLPGVERLAWYRSDRGDADGALKLYRRLEEEGQGSPDIEIIERARRHVDTAPRSIGRNTPCWCGSGRKFKHCHAGRNATVPLEERVDWLIHKATKFVHFGGSEAKSDLIAVVLARADLLTSDDLTDDVLQSPAVQQAARDPLTLDLVLAEMGWFDRFLAARAPLLPPDEVLMAQSWELTDRTLYEVESARPGEGVTVRDLRSAETLAVEDKSFSRQAQAGMVVCGRAVPVGTGYRFLGGLFSVFPGREAEVLDLLDDGDAMEIAAYIARCERPPTLSNREGEPLTFQTTVVAVPDRAAMVDTLDRYYESEPPTGDSEAGDSGAGDSGAGDSKSGDSEAGDSEADGTSRVWHELHDIGDGERILRAKLQLADNELTIEANSEARMDRVLGLLNDAIGPLEVLRQTSLPMSTMDDLTTARSLLPEPNGAPPSAPELGPETMAAMEELRSRYEERWCDDKIPALGGLTPRQAAADPSRRETLERLLRSFEDYKGGGEEKPTFTMRTARLRELLGLVKLER
ncbi:MAG: SEC-C domain-containing protein [Actinomycetota bacterium]|nr:SEC-C domain-containing protein [Actinomycetota bacterium]